MRPSRSCSIASRASRPSTRCRPSGCSPWLSRSSATNRSSAASVANYHEMWAHFDRPKPAVEDLRRALEIGITRPLQPADAAKLLDRAQRVRTLAGNEPWPSAFTAFALYRVGRFDDAMDLID